MADIRKMDEGEQSEEIRMILANEGNVSESPEGGENDVSILIVISKLISVVLLILYLNTDFLD
jgi:hypothetical protein